MQPCCLHIGTAPRSRPRKTSWTSQCGNETAQEWWKFCAWWLVACRQFSCGVPFVPRVSISPAPARFSCAEQRQRRHQSPQQVCPAPDLGATRARLQWLDDSAKTPMAGRPDSTFPRGGIAKCACVPARQHLRQTPRLQDLRPFCEETAKIRKRQNLYHGPRNGNSGTSVAGVV